MKKYIKRFVTPIEADQYDIVDIPFLTTIGSGETVQNIACNAPNKKLKNKNGQIEVVNETPINTMLYLSDGTVIEIISNVLNETVVKRNIDNINDITSCDIGSSVTIIAENTFKYCSGLTCVRIPNSVTSIGDYAFYYCSSLTNVEIDANITTIGIETFYNCRNLTSINIPNSVENIGNAAFSGCTALLSLFVPNNVTNIGTGAFYNMKNVIYSGTATGSPWGAVCINGFVDGYLVYSDSTKTNLCACSSMTKGEIDIPNSVTSIGSNAFSGCIGLTSVTIPNSVTSIGEKAFYGCSGLTSIEIPSSVTIIENELFGCCYNLNSVVIPESVTRIGSNIFLYCEKIFNLNIPNSVTEIGYNAFNGVKHITYSGTATGSPWGADYVNSVVDGCFIYSDSSKTTLLGCDQSTVGEVIIPSTVTTILSTRSVPFDSCENVTSVTIPSSVTTISGSLFSSNCKSLTTVKIYSSAIVGKNYEVKSTLLNTLGDSFVNLEIGGDVTTVGKYAFYSRYSSSKIKNITLSSSVTTIMDYAFGNNINLSTFNIPSTVTSIQAHSFSGVKHIVYGGSCLGSPWGAHYCNGVVDGDLVYSDSTKTTLWCCSTLASGNIVVPNTVTSIGEYSFAYCEDVTSIDIPNTVTNIGVEAFRGCTKITSINIPNGVINIPQYMCLSCKKLTTVTLGNNITSIGMKAFADCDKLSSINLPNSVTTIGISAFEGCDSLTNIILPENLTSIPNRMFYNTPLHNLVIPNSVTSIGQNVFGDSTSNPIVVTSITVGIGVTTISKCAFQCCVNVSTIEIPSTCTTIGQNAFQGITCVMYSGSATGSPWGAVVMNAYVDGDFLFTDSSETTLSGAISSISGDITIPSTVTTINGNGFISCMLITSVTIPDSVTSMDEYAFYYGETADYESLCPIQTFIIGGRTYNNDGSEYLDIELANGTAVTLCLWTQYCFLGGTEITLADGTTKAVEHIQYTDELKVWNFDEGHYDTAYPMWIEKQGLLDKYYRLTLDDGTVLCASGANTGHKIYNFDEHKFQGIVTIEAGTHVFTETGIKEIVLKETIKETVHYYNLMTDRHINCFAEGILTSMRYNSIYPIDTNMKFVKDERELRPYSEFESVGISRYWYDGLRLAEQTDPLKKIDAYVKRLEDKMLPKE